MNKKSALFGIMIALIVVTVAFSTASAQQPAQQVAQDISATKSTDVMPVVAPEKPMHDYSGLVGKYGGSRSRSDGAGGREQLEIKSVAGDKFTGTYYISSSMTNPNACVNRDIEITGIITGEPGNETISSKTPCAGSATFSREGKKLTGKRGTFDVILTR